eukprot:6207983-Pleurochrysis_carterae.AAC.1
MAAAALNMRRAAKSSSGGSSVGGPTAGSSSAGFAQALAVEISEMNTRLDVLKKAKAQMLLAAPFYDAGLASRLVQVRLEQYEQGKAVSTEELEAILHRNSAEHAPAILDLLKAGETTNLIAQGSAPRLPFASPLLVKKTTSRLDDEPASESEPDPPPHLIFSAAASPDTNSIPA